MAKVELGEYRWLNEEVEEGASQDGRSEAAYSSVYLEEEAVAKAIGDDDGDVDSSRRISMWECEWEWDEWRATSISVLWTSKDAEESR
ncbi:hypothetical protein V493_08056 [Pseudogymnoascus sp. VKM F-4281 (FW-2241)]|nr:hypothetical protein V493_08056 [Pseudogymnoascus sp. VKM F-4281 (FW-2241)]